MPEEYIPYSLAAGFNPDFKFAIDLDSEERGRKIAESLPKFELPKFKETYEMGSFFIPKDLKGDDLIFGSEDWLKKAENSNDESLKQAAWDYRIDKATRESADKIKYLNRTFVKEDWQNRYLDRAIGYDPSLSPEQNEERFKNTYWDTKGLLGKVSYGVTAFVSNFVQGLISKTLSSGAGAYELVAGAIGNTADLFTGRDDYNMFASMADNGLIRTMEKWDKNHKDYFMPMYQSMDYNQKGFFAKLLEPTFYTNDVSDGLAFMASMIIPSGGIIKGANYFAKALSLGSKFSKLGKFAQGSKFIAKAITGGDDLGSVMSYTFRTGTEAGMEATDGFKEIKEKLLKDNPGMSEDEANAIAGNKASKIFRDNLAILGLSQMWETRAIYNPIFGKLRSASQSLESTSGRIGKTLGFNKFKLNLGKGLKYEVPKGKNWFTSIFVDPLHPLRFYGSRAATGLIMEGGWEENTQLASTRSAMGEYERYGDDTKGSPAIEKAEGNFLSQWLKQTGDMLTLFGGKGDYEASTSVGIGGLIAQTSLILNKLQKSNVYDISKTDKNEAITQVKGERKAALKQREILLNYVNNAAQNFLDTRSSIWKTDEHGKYLLDDEDTDKLRKAQLSSLGELIALQEGENIVPTDSQRESLQRYQLIKYINALEYIGATDSFLNRINNYIDSMDEKSGEFLAGVDVNNRKEIANNLASLIPQIQNIRKDVRNKVSKVGNTNNLIDNNEEFLDKKLGLSDYAYYLATSDMIMSPIIEEGVKKAKDGLEEVKSNYKDFFINTIKEVSSMGIAIGLEEAQVSDYVDKITKYVDLQAEKDMVESIISDPNTLNDYKTKMKSKLRQINSQIEDYEKTDDFKNINKGDIKLFDEYRIQVLNNKSAEYLVDYSKFKYDAITDPRTGLQNYLALDDFENTLFQTPRNQGLVDIAIKRYSDNSELPIGERLDIIKDFLEDKKSKKNITKEEQDFLDILNNTKSTEETDPASEKKPPEVVVDPLKPKSAEESLKEKFDGLVKKYITFPVSEQQAMSMLKDPLIYNTFTDEEKQIINDFIAAKNSGISTNEKSELTDDEFDLQKINEISEEITQVFNDFFKSLPEATLFETEDELFDSLVSYLISNSIDVEEFQNKLSDVSSYMRSLKEKSQEVIVNNNGKFALFDHLTQQWVLNEDGKISWYESEEEARNQQASPLRVQIRDLRIRIFSTERDIDSIEDEIKENKDSLSSDELKSLNDELKSKKSDLENLNIQLQESIKNLPATRQPSEPTKEAKGVPSNSNEGNSALRDFEIEKADIERRMKEEIESIKEVEKPKGLLGKLTSVLVAGKFQYEKIHIGPDGEFKTFEYGDSIESFKEQIKARYDAELDALKKKYTISKEQTEPQEPLNKGLIHDLSVAKKAVDNGISYDEQARGEGAMIENDIDVAVDNSKLNKDNGGIVTFPTEIPNDIDEKKGELDNRLYQYIKRRLLESLSDGDPRFIDNRGNPKIQLKLSIEKGNIVGTVSDLEGNILYIDKDLNISKSGTESHIIKFNINDISFRPNSIFKNRLVASGINQLSFTNEFGENRLIDENNINDNFKIENFLSYLKSMIDKQGDVYATIDFITQGNLYKKGTLNNPGKKNVGENKTTLSDIIKLNHLFSDSPIKINTPSLKNNIKIQPYSINFLLKRDLNDNDKGYEVIAFNTNTLTDSVIDGNPLLEKEININGSKIKVIDFIQQAIEGNKIPYNQSNLDVLYLFLNPSKYIIANVYGYIKIAEKSHITDLLNSGKEITKEDFEKNIPNILEDIKSSAINFNFDWYMDPGNIPPIITNLFGNYKDLVNNNIYTYSEPVKDGDSIGYRRVNKRLIVSLSKSIVDMKSQEEVKKSSIPEVDTEEKINEVKREEETDKKSEGKDSLADLSKYFGTKIEPC